jgi:hypothetical protein
MLLVADTHPASTTAKKIRIAVFISLSFQPQ